MNLPTRSNSGGNYSKPYTKRTSEQKLKINGNLHSFFRCTTPTWPFAPLESVVDLTTDISRKEDKDFKNFRIIDLFTYYDQPYGHEVPVVN
eukprot:TRINITY_DN6586_c0_g1_i1.p1 TRINITY_DN6586_c0_g1~~TRINITY_DN6586_c0_g1_i1.p1  ORF type:complete len:98 (-),score=12.92 TRINITY_DN6586_c0_g1_i1:164-436(-)